MIPVTSLVCFIMVCIAMDRSVVSYPSTLASFVRFSLNQSYVLTLLYVTHGLNTLIKEKPLCLIPASMIAVRSLRSVEKLCATNVAPAVNAISITERADSIDPLGVLFVLKPISLRGEVCSLVKPYI